ncbi:MAG: hypothetical protein WCG36_08885 [bacterium]
MPRKSRHQRPLLAGRYSQSRVSAEINAAIDRGERGTHKRLSLALGLRTTQQLSHRRKSQYEWSLEEIGVVADFFNAPIGWPFVPWDIGVRLVVGK